MVRHDGVAVRYAIIAAKALRPAALAVSTSLNSRTIRSPRSVAYSFSSLRCAGMENPSRSWSFEETRAYDTASGCAFRVGAVRWCACMMSLDCRLASIRFQENVELRNDTHHRRLLLPSPAARRQWRA